MSPSNRSAQHGSFIGLIPILIIIIMPKQTSESEWRQSDCSHQDERQEVFLGQGKGVSGPQTRNRWTLDENLKYASFLQQRLQDFNTAETRKKSRVFRMLSEHMDNRSTSQAKSHHQKMLGRYKTVENIIKRLRIKAAAVEQKRREIERKRQRELSTQAVVNTILSLESVATDKKEQEEEQERQGQVAVHYNEELDDLLNFYAPRVHSPW